MRLSECKENSLNRIIALDMYNKKIPIDISCGFRIAIEVMGGKWKPYIIYELLDGPKRPSELQRRMPEASESVLAQQLKELMEYGVVQKRVIDPVCRHSEYSLTELGHTLIPSSSNCATGAARPKDACKARTTSVREWRRF